MKEGNEGKKENEERKEGKEGNKEGKEGRKEYSIPINQFCNTLQDNFTDK